MNPDQHLMRLFEQAAELGDTERVAFLDEACAGNDALRAQLAALLKELSESNGFLEQGPQVSPASLSNKNKPAATSAGFFSEEPSDPQQERLAASAMAGQGWAAGAVLGERYRLIERIGSGGMGDVYHATDMRLDRGVAIKWLSRALHLDHEMRRRFEREVKSVAGLSHPNIVTLYDLAEHQGVPLAVMEYVEGRTLRAHIENGLSLRDALRIARDIAAGLAAAHARGVMHRDIKPENVMVTPAPGSATVRGSVDANTSVGVAKVLDFGLARQAALPGDQSLTDTHQTPGTPPYMSPEQVLAREVGCPTDIFSLGTVLFEILAGKNPFRAASAMETMQRISQGATPDLAGFVDAAPSDLHVLLAAMLGKRTHARPTAGTVRDRLEALLLVSGLDQQVGGTPEGLDSSGTETVSYAAVSSGGFGPPTNLPWRSAQLTGRDGELADLAEHLDGGRIVTVLGTGGVGKTSVAYEAARRSCGHFPGGVWLCELAPLRREDGVLEVLASVLDGNAGVINTFEEIVAKLGGEPTLILLDNCEHVIDSAADLIDRLSQQLPNLTVLTTSREGLQITGESVLRLEGLQEADAAKLFVNRAAEQGGFQDESQLEDRVGQIVRQLEGLPLAIELAAPKLAVMSLSELLEALDNQSDTLRTGRRALDRQSTIDQTIAWSFELLEPKEQETLLALSVFAAWFTTEAAVEVSCLHPQAKFYLQRLVEQSVVVRKEERGRSRYRLLEPIRQFCQARIDADALQAARELHARYFSKRVIKKLSLGISGYDELECLHAINAEWPDLRQSAAWGREHRVIEVAIEPFIALGRTGLFQLRTELFEWLIVAEETMGQTVASDAGALAALMCGYWLKGLREESLEKRRQLDAVPPTLFSDWMIAALDSFEGRLEEAVTYWDRFKKRAEETGPKSEQRWARCAACTHPYIYLDCHGARVDELLGVAERQQAEADWLMGDVLYWAELALLKMKRGDTVDARRMALRCIELARRVGARHTELGIGAAYHGARAELETEDKPALLRSAVDDYRELLKTSDRSLLPAVTRGVVVALAACGEAEAAVRGSVLAESLAGIGAKNEFTASYPEMLDGLRTEFGEARFEQLREEGRRWTAEDLLEIGTRTVETH